MDVPQSEPQAFRHGPDEAANGAVFAMARSRTGDRRFHSGVGRWGADSWIVDGFTLSLDITL